MRVPSGEIAGSAKGLLKSNSAFSGGSKVLLITRTSGGVSRKCTKARLAAASANTAAKLGHSQPNRGEVVSGGGGGAGCSSNKNSTPVISRSRLRGSFSRHF